MQHPVHHQAHGTEYADWLPLLLIATTTLLYLYAVIHVSNGKGSWNQWRTISFVIGSLLLGIAVWPSLMQWAHTDLRGHMVQHLLLGMFAPIFLVLGAPITLALKSLPVKAARGVTTILRSNVFHFLSHPIATFFLNIVGMYLLYLTPLYKESLTKPYLHYAIHLHFLVAGYFFTWSMIGPDPAPKRTGLRIRVLVLFFSFASHAFLSKLMYAYLYPLNSPHPGAQIREAAKLMYYWGGLSELLLAIAIFAIWYQKCGRPHYDLKPLVS